MLTLPIKKKWFDMILAGEKREEYRALTSRYKTMFQNASRVSDVFPCRIRNGYESYRPSAIIMCKYRIDYGRPEWGAVPGQKYCVLEILSVEKE